MGVNTTFRDVLRLGTLLLAVFGRARRLQYLCNDWPQCYRRGGPDCRPCRLDGWTPQQRPAAAAGRRRRALRLPSGRPTC